MRKIGFACKFSELHPKKGVVSIPELNTGGTTVAWLNRQTREVAEQKLWDLMVHNIKTTQNLIEKIGDLDENLRMVRISSDILPVYTENSWSYFWRKPDVINYCERNFLAVGDIARKRSVRLSFHPGQFCVLASDNPDIVNRSIEEFEYHADMVRWMGYGLTFQDFKINVHISGRQGPEGIRRAYTRLSPEARNSITIENEEMSHGLDDCLSISDLVPIVLDCHHHWIREGEYIQPDDNRVQMIINSWRGIRPTMHYSVSREDILTNHERDNLPNHSQLLEQGHKKQKLRAHSDFYWNDAVNKWALSFLDMFDLMCESKSKNLASFALAKQAQDLGLF